MDNVVNAEKAALGAGNIIVECFGYAAGSEVPVASKVYSTTGTCSSAGGGEDAPGECAALVRYATAGRTSKNHPIYLFNYYHGVYNVGGASSTADQLLSGMRTALGTYAAAWISGFSDGSLTLTRTGPQGHPATGYNVEEYITHRDFPYSTSL
jgi:hypothetical protein